MIIGMGQTVEMQTVAMPCSQIRYPSNCVGSGPVDACGFYAKYTCPPLGTPSPEPFTPPPGSTVTVDPITGSTTVTAPPALPVTTPAPVGSGTPVMSTPCAWYETYTPTTVANTAMTSPCVTNTTVLYGVLGAAALLLHLFMGRN